MLEISCVRRFGGACVAAVVSAVVALSSAPACAAPPPQLPPERVAQIQAFGNALASSAATYGAPIVAMYLLRDTVCFGAKPKAAPNDIWRIQNIATPEIAEQAGYVTPNVNVIYGFGFMDLQREPIVLSVPNSNDRYYMVEIVDMWSNAFAYVGGVATGYKGGTYAVVGPGWKGKLPANVKRIDSPTRWIELQPRVHVKDQADLADAETILSAITVMGLAKYKGGAAPAPASYDYPVPKINTKVASSLMQFDDPLQFWEIFSVAMNESPPPASEIKSVLPQFKLLGIELGKPWKRENVSPVILGQMQKAAAGIGPMSVASGALLGKLANGWILPPANMGNFGADYPTRAVVAVFGLTANTPVEALYFTSAGDANIQPMTGAKKYSMTFTEPMDYLKSRYPGFWSLTMYDNVTFLTVPNPIKRYSLGSDDELKRNANGSFTIYIQHDDPGEEKRSNWLPASTGLFYLILRNYAPVAEVAKGLETPATFVGPPPVIPEE